MSSPSGRGERGARASWTAWAWRLALGAVCLALVVEFTSRLGGSPSPGNLAAAAQVHAQGIAGVAEYVLRGSIPPEGSAPLDERRLVLAGREARIELDFGRTVSLAALLVQAEAHDAYRLGARADEAPWRRVAVVTPAPGTGLRSRTLLFDPPLRLRALRLVPMGEGGLGVLGAVRAYASLPPGWPDALVEPAFGTWPLVRTIPAFMYLRLAVAALGALAVVALAVLERGGVRRRGIRSAEAALVAAGLLSGLASFDFLQNSRPQGFVWTLQNPWDVSHYYLGAKYASQLGYTELYHCIVTADLEDGFGALRAANPLVRELRTNEIVPLGAVSATPERCRVPFAPDDWQRFKRDVAWFRSHLPPTMWLQLTMDHGYNPSPAWAVLGGAVARLVPLSEAGFAGLMALDTILLVTLWGFAWRTFGLRATCIALVFLGTSYASGHWWTHGAMLRSGWLFLTVIALCCLRERRETAAGALLGYAACLRIFPAFFGVGVAARALATMVWERRPVPTRAELRFAAGVLGAAVLIVGAAMVATDRPAVWQEFVRNTQKHYDVEASNMLGFLTATSVAEAARGESGARAPGSPGTLGPGLRRLRLAVAIAFAVPLLLAVRREEPWVAAILGSAWIPFVTDLGSYYFVYLAVFGFLVPRRAAVGVGLTLLALVLATLGAIYQGEQVREVFVWSSVAIVAFCGWVTALFAASRTAPRRRT